MSNRIRGDRIAKAGFLTSLLTLGVVYGIAAHAFGWFPTGLLERAYLQAKAVAPALSLGGGSPPFAEPRVYYDRTGVRIVDRDAVQPGLTLIASMWKDFEWKPGLKLIDREGRVVHEWKADPEEIFPEDAPGRRSVSHAAQRSVHGVHLFENGDILVNIDYVGTARMDACGRVIWRLNEGGHHSIARFDDGTFWIPTSSFEPQLGTPNYPDGPPGLERPVYQDRIVKVSRNGEILEEINLLDVLYENDLERHIAKQGLWDTDDVTHLNDIEPLSASMADEYPQFDVGDLLLSPRNLDLVMVLDPTTRSVKWYVSEPFIQQHDPDYLGEGWVGVFDNNKDGTDRGKMLGGSRIIALHPHTDSTELLFQTTHSEAFYTGAMGKFQKLENGNLLLTESQAGRVVEIAPDGRTVWEWIQVPYSDSLVPEVSEGSRYSLSLKEVADWPCSKLSPSLPLGQ